MSTHPEFSQPRDSLEPQALAHSSLPRGCPQLTHSRFQDEYGRVFNGKLLGEDVQLCLPKDTIPDKGLVDFTSCSAKIIS